MKKHTPEELKNITHITDEEIAEATHDISVSYLLISMANEYQDRCNDILASRGLNLHDINYFHNNLVKAFDKYLSSIHVDKNTDILQRYEELQGIINNFVDDDGEKWNWQTRYYFIKSQFDELKQKYELLQKGTV